MKANNGSGNNVERDNWQTPTNLFYKLHEQYKFDFDCCANRDNRLVLDYSNNFLSSAGITIFKCVWMNPPFSKAKEMFKHFFNVVKSGVAIYRCDNLETEIWQNIILKKATWVFFPKGRVDFEGMKGKGSRFPSALIGYNVDPPINIKGRLLKTGDL